MAGFPINPPNAPLVDQRGYVTPEWYRYFAAVQKLIGGSPTPWEDIDISSGSAVSSVAGRVAAVPGEIEAVDLVAGGRDSGLTALGVSMEFSPLGAFPPPQALTITPVDQGGTGVMSLASNYLVKGNGEGAITASVIYDDGTNIGIGTNTPTEKLEVAGDIYAAGAGTAIYATDKQFAIYVSGSNNPTIEMDSGGDYFSFSRAANTYEYRVGGTIIAQFNASSSYLVINGLPRALEYGAADSGGVGKRAVVVAN